MNRFEEFFRAVLDGARDEAGDTLQGFLKETTTDSAAFKAQAKQDLEQWTRDLAAGEIDKDMFKDLVRGQWDTAVLAALAKTGESAARTQHLRNKVVGIAIDAAFKLLL
jgi:hypothetical protein